MTKQMIATVVRFFHIAMLACVILCLSLTAVSAVTHFPPSNIDHSLFNPVYRIPLYVHLVHSSRPSREFTAVFAEINRIWLSQAGIYFDIKEVLRDEISDDGLDMYFSPDIGGLNGYYDGELIRMSDHPQLRPALHPSSSAAGRTAAHELGHALGLRHRQDSDDNLMRSKTFGWWLSKDEIKSAREGAKILAAD